MITVEKIQSFEKEDLANIAPTLETADLPQLVDWLNEKDDNLRYKSFLLLQQRSQQFNDVYPFWDVFVSKFTSANSYQRSLGLMLVAENVRWDESGKFDEIIDRYLAFCDDEKPVTVRQCIQSLSSVVPYKKALHSKIVDRLTSIELMERKETQRKLLLMDIITILALIRKEQSSEKIDRYIHEALMGGILDDKSKKIVKAL